MVKTTHEKIKDKVEIQDRFRQTKHYSDAQIGDIIDLLAQEIEELKNRLDILEK